MAPPGAARTPSFVPGPRTERRVAPRRQGAPGGCKARTQGVRVAGGYVCD